MSFNIPYLFCSYGVDLCFTPMVLADSFCQNGKARASEFATTVTDTPLIVQFAANNVDDFVDASTLVYPYADGVDLNCGCPQRWAMKDGYGCALLSKPQIIQDLVKGVRNNLPNTFSVSVKVRLLKEIKKTIEICRQLEKCGVTFLTVHGRTPEQNSAGVVDIGALKDICEIVKIPVIANGGVRTSVDADDLHAATNCNGVMAASGLLANPALFSGSNRTPLSCVEQWISMKDKDSDRISFQCYHHHLVFMLDKVLSKQEKQVFNLLNTFQSVDEFLYKHVFDSLDGCHVDVKYSLDEFVACEFSDEITLKHAKKCRACGKSIYYCVCSKYDPNSTDGSFFNMYVKDCDVLDYMDSNMFNESV